MPKSPRKFAVTPWLWSSDYIGDNFAFLEKAKRFGFDGVEFPNFDGRLDPLLAGRALDSLARVTSGRLVPIVLTGGMPEADLSSDDAQIRRKGMEKIKRSVADCAAIGGTLVGGPVYSPAGKAKYLTDAERRKEYETISSYLKEIAEFARGLKVRLAVEPLCRYDAYLLNTVAQARELVDLIDEENVGILFDTFHANIEEKSMSGAIETAGEKLFYIQACENDRGTPGSGQVRWEEFARGLDKIGYDGWITVESFTPSEKEFASRMRVWRKLEANQDSIAVDGLAFLKRLMASRG